jgi:predicted transcriptional regulator
MGKAQKKTGKGRIDKFYKLAKYVSVSFMVLPSLVLTKNYCPSTENKAIGLVQPSSSFN